MVEESSSDPPKGMVGGRNLPVAIGVGVVLAGLFLASLFWRAEAFILVVAILAMIACIEVARILAPTGIRLLTPVLLAATLVLIVSPLYAGESGQLAGIALLLVGSVAWLIADPGRRDVVRTLAMTLLFGLWIGFLASYATLLVDRPDGPVVVLAVIGAAAFTDIGGYAFGVTFGRHKVAPSISPNKTWEGLIGGVAVAAILGGLVLPLFGDTFTAVSGAVIAATCAVATFLGDLFESMVKRDLGVKDMGDLLPAHGGILDRVDGILFALPVGHYALALFT